VTQADVDAMVENLRNQRPVYTAVERPSQDGDRVTMDFLGQIDGQPFEGSKGDNVAVQLGSGRMLREFDAAIAGLRAGERRTIEVRYPDDYHNKDLAGRVAQFDVHVKAVDERSLPSSTMRSAASTASPRAASINCVAEVEDNMRRELEDKVRNRMKTELLDRSARSKSGRGAALARRCAGARDAARHRAPHRREGRVTASTP
jgi:trigger factor